MSDAIFIARSSGMALKNDALRDAFALDGVRCFLLKREGQTKRYSSLVELTTGHRVKFDDSRAESGLFRYATTDLTFRDTWAQTSHIGYGVPDDDTKIEVYSFADGEKDTIDPDGSSVYWAGRIVKVKNERYQITIPPTPDLEITDCGVAGLIGEYFEQGTYNSKPFYAIDGMAGNADLDNAVTGIYWNGATWGVSLAIDGTQYYSDDDVATPDLVTNWQLLLGTLPAPTIVLL